MKNQVDEQYIIQLIREGKTNIEIAGKVYKSVSMVKYYVSSLMKKHNCKNRTQLAMIIEN